MTPGERELAEANDSLGRALTLAIRTSALIGILYVLLLVVVLGLLAAWTL